jgi:hypothetical protein
VAGRGATVPAEVVELVAGIRHRQLVDDPAVLRVDDGEEVGLLHASSLAQTYEVEELLRGRLQRLLRRRVKRSGFLVHDDLLGLGSMRARIHDPPVVAKAQRASSSARSSRQ